MNQVQKIFLCIKKKISTQQIKNPQSYQNKTKI